MPQRGAVVVGAVVQAASAGHRRRGSGGHGGRRRRRRAPPAASPPAPRSAAARPVVRGPPPSAPHRTAMRLDLLTALTFGRVTTNPSRQRPERVEEHVEGAYGTAAGRASRLLQRMPDKRRHRAGPHRRRRGPGVGILPSSSRTPYPSSKSTRRSSTGSRFSLASTRSRSDSGNGSGGCARRASSACSRQSPIRSAWNRSAGT